MDAISPVTSQKKKKKQIYLESFLFAPTLDSTIGPPHTQKHTIFTNAKGQFKVISEANRHWKLIETPDLKSDSVTVLQATLLITAAFSSRQ